MLIGSHVRAAGMTRVTNRGTGLWVHVVGNDWQATGRTKNRLLFEGSDGKWGVPVGYAAPQAWLLPVKTGGLSASALVGDGEFAGSAAGGKNAEASIAGSGDVASAVCDLVVSAIAAIAGSGALTAAGVAYLNAVATVAGTGDLQATCAALGWVLGDSAGSGGMSVTLRADGELDADITPFTDLSPQNLAAAVWSTAEGQFLYAVAHNRVVTDPSTGTYTVYDTDDATVLYVADLWEDAAGTTPYQGSGAERRDRIT